jgi:hypothetical protein
MRRKVTGLASFLTMFLLINIFLTPQTSCTLIISDTMDSGWTITVNSGGSASASGGYSTTQYTSPSTSIRAYLANGGTDGKDYGKILAEKDFALNMLENLKINYYIAQQTDSDDGWGGMAARAEICFITHDTSGDHIHRYIIAGSETDCGIYNPDHYCDAQPNAVYVDETNTLIPAPGDAELEPSTGVWYTLDRDVNSDFTIDWSTVTHITIQIAHYGAWMYKDKFETFYDDLELTGKMCLSADIDIDPNTLNLKSKGKWVTCYIELPSGYDVRDIDATTILLEDSLQPELDLKYGFVKSESSYIMDHDGDGILERMVKFDRSDVEDMLSPGTYNLKVIGQLLDGTEFEGYSDTITVINPP